MSTETAADEPGADESGLSDHIRGITVTTLACLAGITAALVSASIFGTTTAAAANRQSVLVLFGFIAIQYPVLKLVGVDIDEFGIKDNLYITFMTFTLWFISYGVLLSSG